MQSEDAQTNLYRCLLQRLGEFEAENRLLEFELETQASVVQVLEESCAKMNDNVSKDLEELRSLEHKSTQAKETLKLHEESYRAVEASLRHEAASYHSLKNDLHETMSTHKQLASARNRGTFEKRLRITTVLGQESSRTQIDQSTDADACVAGEHSIAQAHRTLDSELAASLQAHPLLCALSESDEARLRRAMACMRESQRLIDENMLSDDALHEMARICLSPSAQSKQALKPLSSLIHHIVYKWDGPIAECMSKAEMARLRAAAVRDGMLGGRTWYCKPEDAMFGSASLQQAVDSNASRQPKASHTC